MAPCANLAYASAFPRHLIFLQFASLLGAGIQPSQTHLTYNTVDAKLNYFIRGIQVRFIIRLFFRTLRSLLGPFLLLAENITSPKVVPRSDEEQQALDQASTALALYQFNTCPFCIKVRREIKRLSLNIQLLDAQHNEHNREQLQQGGGQIKVPCLRITNPDSSHTWLYESDDIIAYLRERFDSQAVGQYQQP